MNDLSHMTSVDLIVGLKLSLYFVPSADHSYGWADSGYVRSYNIWAQIFKAAPA